MVANRIYFTERLRIIIYITEIIMRTEDVGNLKFIKPLKKYLPKPLRIWLRSQLVKDPLTISKKEVKRLGNCPRYFKTTSTVFGQPIQLTDPYWYLFMYREIFHEQIYKFVSKNNPPHIIDCGSNIGLSVLYFKYLYPNAKIIAFEPDPEIFNILESNLRAFGYQGITLHQKAVWNCDNVMPFFSEGSVGGRLSNQIDDGQKLIKVSTVRLKDYLEDHIDFLKIDIEGAEIEVIEDCAELLRNVEHLFVEYHGTCGEEQRLHHLLDILAKSSFRYHIREANPIKHPFVKEERARFYDLQLNIYCYRE
jgi:FkbM family methyltransferase